MAQKLSATVEIGAALNGSFGKAFSSAESRLKEFGSTLKVFKDAESGIKDLISAESDLERAQKANTEAMREYARLQKQSKQSWTDKQIAENAKALEAQKKKVDAARAALDKKQSSVRKLGEVLRKSGVDTKNLSGEMERLARQSDKTRERMKMMGSIKGFNLGPMGSKLLPALMLRFPAFGRAVQTMSPAIAGAIPMLGAVAGSIAAVGAAALAASYGAFKLGQSFSNWVDDAQDVADGLNMQIGDLIRLRFAAADAGIEAGKFDQQLSKLQQSLQGAVEGSKEQKKAFEELGLDAVVLQALNTEEAFAEIAEGFKNYKGNVSKAAIANDIFGKGATRLIGVLDKGKAGLKDYYDRADRASVVPNDSDLKKAQEFDRQWNDLQQTLIGIRNTLAAPLLDGLGDAMRNFGKWLSENKPFINEWAETTGKMLKTLASELPIILELMGKFAWLALKIAQAFNWVAEKSGKVGEAIGGFFYDDPNQGRVPQGMTHYGFGASNFQPPRLAPAGGAGNGNRTVNMTVNAAPGQSEKQVADEALSGLEKFLNMEAGALTDGR